MSRGLTIGTLARRAEVNIETVRYYERIGLMPRAKRQSNGRRIYSESEVRTLAFIRRARELDFHIEDIRALLVFRDAAQACSDVKVIASRHLEEIRAKARRALEVERILTEALAGCPGGGPSASCPVLKVLESVV